jgi:hypothetical protein
MFHYYNICINIFPKPGIKNRKAITNNVFLYISMVNTPSWTENMDIFACDPTTDTPEIN